MKLFTREELARTDAEQLAAQLKVLADPIRLQILANPNLPNCGVKRLADLCGITQPTMSHHLQILVAAGFLTPERHGQYVFHTLNRGEVRTVAAALSGGR